jgi:hypothetical protein
MLPLFNSETGSKLKELLVGQIIRVSRRKMRALCKEGIDVQYEKEIVGLDFDDNSKHATLILKHNTKARGTMVVGADGPPSRSVNCCSGLKHRRRLSFWLPLPHKCLLS